MQTRNTRYYMNQTNEFETGNTATTPSLNPPASTREPGAQKSESFDTGVDTNAQNSIPSTPEPITPEPATPGGETLFANENDIFFSEDSEGEITVRAQTALGAFPVSEATVIISRVRDGSNQIVNFQLTDESGKTPNISVPAPSKADSLSPSDSLPFSDYNVTVRHPMYYTSIIDNVQVFGDQLTILVAELTPLPEFVNETDITRTVNIPRQNL